MTKEEIQALYRQQILPENKAPYHFEKVASAHAIKAYNPMCGDKYELYIDKDASLLSEMHFHGIGCAISKASSSILLRKVEGMTQADAAGYCEAFLQALASSDASELTDEELKILVELKNFEGRVDCIKLSWEALLEELKHG